MQINSAAIGSTKVRKSNIELLKIIAIFLICISHCTQTLSTIFSAYLPTTDITLLILKIPRHFGALGNQIFIICSSYFLLESNRTKKRKIINLLLDSQIISIGIFVLYCTALKIAGEESICTTQTVLENLFPDLFSMVWFVPAYAIFYFFHPYVNRIINSINQKEHFVICFAVFIFYGIGGLIGADFVFSELTGFFAIYFLVAYMKRYCKSFMNHKKKNATMLSVSICLLIMTIIIKNYLGLHFKFFEYIPYLIGTLSIALLPISISLFNLFFNLNITNKIINYLSSCSLFVYCIHENYIVREYLRPAYYDIMIDRFGSDKLLLYLIILVALLFTASFAAAIIYKQTVGIITAKLSIKIRDFLSDFSEKLMIKIHKQ